MSNRLLRRLGVVVGAGAVAAAGFGVGAYAIAPRVTQAAPGPYHVCVNRESHKLTKIFGGDATPSCPAGDILYAWKVKGEKGATGPRGPRGLQGPQGPQGESATLTVTAMTAIANWPEGSGWATDNFTRTLVLTRQHAAESSKCGGTPQCWFYTGTLADNGTSTTVDGHASPNGSADATINGAFDVTMIGGAHVEFYASSDDPDGTRVPASADGSDKPATTSTWYQLAFPAGTTFEGGNLTQYTWTYSSACQTWTDSINPGDDGQGPADGNITHECTPVAYELDNGASWTLASGTSVDSTFPITGNYADIGIVVDLGRANDFQGLTWHGSDSLAANIWLGDDPEAYNAGTHPLSDTVKFSYGPWGGTFWAGPQQGNQVDTDTIQAAPGNPEVYAWVGITFSGSSASGEVTSVTGHNLGGWAMRLTKHDNGTVTATLS
ncbi:MAG TPA: hypothetical protein VE442_11300 [Jatrophihabitans sp.]|nr:hypothetical protein [Jatrophihabitans sp.]